MNIALFGDLHGRVLVPFYLLALWEANHRQRVDYALCVGDVGVYRSLWAMESTSRRWAKKFPEELGFSKFLFSFDLQSKRISRVPAADEVLSRTRADLYFVPGNHEEHAYFDWIWDNFAYSNDEPVAVDRDWHGIGEGQYGDDDFYGYERLWCLPQGQLVTLPGPIDDATGEPRFEIKVMAVNGLDGYTEEHVWSVKPNEQVDLLLTHGTYHSRLSGTGSSRRRDDCGSVKLKSLIERIRPRFHFFGHHHWYYPEVTWRVTRSVGLNQIFFDVGDPRQRHRNNAPLKPGGFGILRVFSPDEMSFEIVEESWLERLRLRDCSNIL